MSNFEANPLNGGMPAIANAPIMKKIAVYGIVCPSPPISFKFLVLSL